MSVVGQEAAIWHSCTIFYKGAIKENCYANRPETIKHLKANIRDTIVEIQFQTLEKVHEKWYDEARRVSHIN